MPRFLSTMILQDTGKGGKCFRKVECLASDCKRRILRVRVTRDKQLFKAKNPHAQSYNNYVFTNNISYLKLILVNNYSLPKISVIELLKQKISMFKVIIM